MSQNLRNAVKRHRERQVRRCLAVTYSDGFHDNLVAHEAEIAREDNGYSYRGTCWKWLSNAENRAKWMERTNWIAPEDVPRYDGLCAAFKSLVRADGRDVGKGLLLTFLATVAIFAFMALVARIVYGWR